MANINFRIVVPTSPAKLVKLAEQLMKKHVAEGENSVLNIIDIDDFITTVKAAAERHDEAIQLRMASEKATEDRNNMLGIARDQFSSTKGTILFYVKAIREILLGVFKGSEHSLGDWGFEVNTSLPPNPTEIQEDGFE